jgi:hypothetical protein
MLLVSEEDDITELLCTKIRMSTHYARQRGNPFEFVIYLQSIDTIITWMDEET